MQRVKEPVQAGAGALGQVAEQIGEAVVQDAACAQPAVIGGVLVAASPADMLWRGARAVAAARLREAGVGHQSACPLAARAEALGVQRALVTGGADRSFGPVRGHAPLALAVRAALRRRRSADVAEHPTAPLATAWACTSAALALEGRSRPADGAQIRVVASRQPHDRADPPAAPARGDRAPVAGVTARAVFAVAAGRHRAAHVTRSWRRERATRAARHRACGGHGRGQAARRAVRARTFGALRADGPAGAVGLVDPAQRAAMHRAHEQAAVTGAAQRATVLVVRGGSRDLRAARAALRRASTPLAAIAHPPTLDREAKLPGLLAVQAPWVHEPVNPGGAQLADQRLKCPWRG